LTPRPDLDGKIFNGVHAVPVRDPSQFGLFGGEEDE
jgi:hypothetical protein